MLQVVVDLLRSIPGLIAVVPPDRIIASTWVHPLTSPYLLVTLVAQVHETDKSRGIAQARALCQIDIFATERSHCIDAVEAIRSHIDGLPQDVNGHSVYLEDVRDIDESDAKKHRMSLGLVVERQSS